MSAEKPHVLLLDEPTNHLDIDSRQALIEAINGFAGAVVIISHDPNILELTVDQFWLVEKGRVTTFDGDMDDYRAKLLARTSKQHTPRVKQPAAAAPAQTDVRKEERKRGVEQRGALAPLKRRLQKAEENIGRLEKERDRLRAALADPALYQGDKANVVDLQRQLGHVDSELASVEESWIGMQEELERPQPAAD